MNKKLLIAILIFPAFLWLKMLGVSKATFKEYFNEGLK